MSAELGVRRLATSVVCGAMLSGVVSAGATPRGELPPFEQADTNQDGAVTRDEAATIEGLDFDAADVNRDGKLDRSEYLAAATKNAQR